MGLAIPGPFQRYGVLDRSANLPPSFTGFDVHTAYSGALAQRAGRAVPLAIGNDGDLGGVAEAQHVRGPGTGTVVMLAPGSGLGCAYVGRDGLPLTGDTLAGMEAGHMPSPLHLLGAPAYPCGCGRTWGCVEVYTTLSGLPYLLAAKLTEHPEHELARSPLGPKERALALRGLAQKGDALAVELFDFQARALGLHVANLAMALDPEFVVVGGGLMDPEATTELFRERVPADRARDGGAVLVPGAAGAAERRAGGAGGPVAGDRGGAGGALPGAGVRRPGVPRQDLARFAATRQRSAGASRRTHADSGNVVAAPLDAPERFSNVE